MVVMDELLVKHFSSRKPFNLYKRAFASLLDKVFISLWFLILALIVFGPYTAPGYLGTYTAVLEIEPGMYDFSPNGDFMYDIDIQCTILFIIANILYYCIEFLSKASLGKRIFGAIYIDVDGYEISNNKVFLRCTFLIIMMIGAIIIRFAFNLTYWHVIILFFLVNDLPILLTKKHRSFIDISSNTYLVKRINNSEREAVMQNYNPAKKKKNNTFYLMGLCIGRCISFYKKCIYYYKQGLNS